MNYFKNAFDYCLSNRKFTLITLAISLANAVITFACANSVIGSFIAILAGLFYAPILFASAYSIKNGEKLQNIPLLLLKYLPLYALSAATGMAFVYLAPISDISYILGIFVFILLSILSLVLLVICSIYPPLAISTKRAYRLIFKHPLASAGSLIRHTWFFFVIAWIVVTIITWANLPFLKDILTVIACPLTTYLYLTCAEELASRFGE